MKVERRSLVMSALLLSVASGGVAQSTEHRFVAVIAVVSKYEGTLQHFNFSGVAARIEVGLRRLASLRGYQSKNVDIHILEGSGGDKEPTDGRIKQFLKEGLRLSENDTFVFHFLGHGVTTNAELLLLSSGAESTNDIANNVSTKVLEAVMSKSRAGLRLAFLDVCQVLVNAQGPGLPLTPESQATLDQMVKSNPGVAVYLATQSGKPAWVEDEPTPDKRQIGYFTKQVVEAFTNPDRLVGTGPNQGVMVEDMATFLAREVPAAVRKAHPLENQEPTVLNNPQRDRTFLFRLADRDSPVARSAAFQRTALVFKIDLPKGSRLRSDHFSQLQASEATLGKASLPETFDVDIRGACLTRDVKASEVVGWEELGVSSTCIR